MEFLSIFPLVSFFILLISLISRVIYLRKRGIKMSSKQNEKPLYLKFLYPVFALIFLLWTGELFRLAFHLPSLVLPEIFTANLVNFHPLKMTGAIVILLALVFWILTLFHFHFSLRFGLDNKNQGKLITRGIFSRSRNPFFLSIDLFFSGLALLHASLFFIVMAVLTIISIHFFILKEEKFLRKHYGEAYRKYQEKVRRYF